MIVDEPPLPLERTVLRGRTETLSDGRRVRSDLLVHFPDDVCEIDVLDASVDVELLGTIDRFEHVRVVEQ